MKNNKSCRMLARGWPLKKCSYTCLKYANFTQITQILRKLRKFYANYAKYFCVRTPKFWVVNPSDVGLVIVRDVQCLAVCVFHLTIFSQSKNTLMSVCVCKLWTRFRRWLMSWGWSFVSTPTTYNIRPRNWKKWKSAGLPRLQAGV